MTNKVTILKPDFVAAVEFAKTEDGRMLTEKLRQTAIKYCDLPRSNMTENLNAQKKAAEIKYISSAAKLCFMACSLLTAQTRPTRQALLEVNHLKTRIERTIQLLESQIDIL